MRSHVHCSRPRIGLTVAVSAALIAAMAPGATAATGAEVETTRPAICQTDPTCDVADTTGVAEEATAPAPQIVTPSTPTSEGGSQPTALTAATPAVLVNGPANPPNPAAALTFSTGLTVLSHAAALGSRPYAMPHRPTHHRAIAPHTTTTGLRDGRILFRVGQPVRLIVKVPASTVFDIRVKAQGRWHSLGGAVSDERGWLSLPVVSAAQPGTYLVSLFDTSLLSLYYLKLRVRP